MAGVVPILPPRNGFMNGKLQTQYKKSLTMDELLANSPGVKDFFDELSEKGWRYYFIDGYGMVTMELEVESSEYSFGSGEHPRGGFAYSLSLDFERCLPKLQLKDIVNVERFVVNICSKHYPRGVTIDLTKNKITYVHESLWVSEGAEGVEEAKDVLNILKWLIEEKKFKLGGGEEERYRELVAFLGGK